MNPRGGTNSGCSGKRRCELCVCRLGVCLCKNLDNQNIICGVCWRRSCKGGKFSNGNSFLEDFDLVVMGFFLAGRGVGMIVVDPLEVVFSESPGTWEY